MAAPTDSEVMASTVGDIALLSIGAVACAAAILSRITGLGLEAVFTPVGVLAVAGLVFRLNQRLVAVLHRQRKRSKQESL